MMRGLSRPAGWWVPALLISLAAVPALANSPVHWEASFAQAKVRAAREHKPILLLQMFGRLDEEMC